MFSKGQKAAIAAAAVAVAFLFMLLVEQSFEGRARDTWPAFAVALLLAVVFAFAIGRRQWASAALAILLVAPLVVGAAWFWLLANYGHCGFMPNEATWNDPSLYDAMGQVRLGDGEYYLDAAPPRGLVAVPEGNLTSVGYEAGSVLNHLNLVAGGPFGILQAHGPDPPGEEDDEARHEAFHSFVLVLTGNSSEAQRVAERMAASARQDRTSFVEGQRVPYFRYVAPLEAPHRAADLYAQPGTDPVLSFHVEPARRQIVAAQGEVAGPVRRPLLDVQADGDATYRAGDADSSAGYLKDMGRDLASWNLPVPPQAEVGGSIC